MKEVFREIAGYNGLYEISNLGNVRSLGMWKKGKGNSSYFQEGRVLKPQKDKDGYLQVNLYKDGNQKHHKVHRLVATAFIENTDSLPEVNHIDEDKTNNRVSNLEWCTTKYNHNYGTRTERMAETQSKRPLQLTLDYTLIKEWSSINECGRNGFCQTAVSLCCRNKYYSQGNVYKGYRWMYAKDYYKMFA